MKVAILIVLLLVRIHRCLSAEEKDFCGPPPKVDRATILDLDGEQHEQGKKITYNCDFGYTAEGAGRTSECDVSEDGASLEWTDPEISCIPRSCGFPGYVENSQRIGSRFTFPNNVAYECHEGYKLVGDRQRFCQTSGIWSGKLPTCKKVFCGEPKSPKNGRVTYSSLEFGSELNFECDNGFRLQEKEPRYCTADGSWSGVDPECVEANCDFPESPEDGTMDLVGEKIRIGSVVLYACNEGRRLVGSPTSKCLSTQEWTFPAPKCIEPCKVPEASNGVMGVYETTRWSNTRSFKRITSGISAEDGKEIVLRCFIKYESFREGKSEVSAVCRDGQWSDVLQCKPTSCKSNPPPVDNAQVQSVKREHGGSVVYTCRQYYSKTPGNVTCNSGTWTGPKPVCRDNRCDRNSLNFPGLSTKGQRYFTDGRSFKPLCTDGYNISRPNNSELKCVNGQWVGHLPPCRAASCSDPPPDINHGNPKHYTGIHSSTVTYECEPLYFLEGSSDVQCLFGKWSGKPPTCRDSRCYQKDLNLRKGIALKPDQATHTREYAYIECERDYQLKYQTPQCSQGVWEEQSVSPCAPKECIIQHINNGAITILEIQDGRFNIWKLRYEKNAVFREVPLGTPYHNSIQYYISCDEGYAFQGRANVNSAEVKCVRGSWEPRPVCLRPGTPYNEVRTSLGPNFKPTVSTQQWNGNQRRISTKSDDYEVVTSISIDSRKASVDAIVPMEPPNFEILHQTCNCTYQQIDKDVLAYAGQERLRDGTLVRDNSTVKFFCRNYKFSHLRGATELVCKDCRQWHSSEFPTCSDPAPGDVVILWRQEDHNLLRLLPSGILSASPGATLRLVCYVFGRNQQTYWRSPNPERVHLSHGYWGTQENPYMISILDIPYANLIHNGQYECTSQSKSRSIQLEIQETIEVCSVIETDDSVKVTLTNYAKINSKAHFSCNIPGQMLHGPSDVTCQPNGNWSQSPPKCEAVHCPILKQTDSMVISYSDHQNVSSMASFHCFNPYNMKGVGHVTCLDTGSWSGPPSSCSLSVCDVATLYDKVPEGVVPKIEDISNQTMPFGAVIRLSCEDDNFLLAGGTSATCGKEGEWNVGKLQCILGCAPVEKVNSSLIIHPVQDIYLFGNNVVFSCPDGETLSSDVVRIVCLRDGWSEKNLPDCKKV